MLPVRCRYQGGHAADYTKVLIRNTVRWRILVGSGVRFLRKPDVCWRPAQASVGASAQAPKAVIPSQASVCESAQAPKAVIPAQAGVGARAQAPKAVIQAQAGVYASAQAPKAVIPAQASVCASG
jgi:hypothetical protein